jgi:hypothetical protein
MLAETFHQASYPRRGVDQTRNVLGLLKYLFDRRRDLWLALEAVHTVESRVVREAMIAHHLHPEPLLGVQNRSALVKEWLNLLAEAGVKVQRERREAALSGEVAANPSEEDRSWREVQALVAARRWKSK